ncbi:Lsr2 family protein [Streptomyces sp. NPDC057717]|uniref:histone-like nucleoid-structuring protein Lsr2 n=1 Tax=Streptomyces sp. NPDC057717 TaxID=3346224 RepID=UPI0036C35F97
MSQKTVIVYTDDLTGAESNEVQTHHFSLNGVTYEIDLTPDSYDRLDEALRPFLEAGRKTGRAKVKRSVHKSASDSPSADEVRAWAKAQGIAINDRGRVPSAVREQYEAAH